MTDPRARPTLFVPLVGIPALLIFVGGGLALAMVHARAAENVVPGVTPAVELADENRIPNGAYVETEGTFEPHRHGLQVEGAPDVVVHRPARPGGPQRVVGRVCNVSNPPIGCDIPNDPPVGAERWLMVDMTPQHSVDRIAKPLGVAAIAVLAYVAIVAFSRRRRKGPPRAVDERTWTLRSPAEDVARAVRTLHGTDRFQVVDEGPGRIVFIQGYSENAARGWGIREANVFPRRVTLTWKSSPREPTQVSARVEEDLVWWRGPLTPTMDRLARESIASTIHMIEGAIGTS